MGWSDRDRNEDAGATMTTESVHERRPNEGLRERKKRATRRALSDAALRLALDRGVANLTVEEISEAAGVSARTFFNYFCDKEQALFGDRPPLADPERVTALMRDADSVVDGLHRIALTAVAASADSREHMWMRWKLLESCPELTPRLFAKLDGLREVLAAAVAARVGGEPTDVYPQLMAGVAFAALRLAVVRWVADHHDRRLERHVDEVFGLLAREIGAAGGRGDVAAVRRHEEETR